MASAFSAQQRSTTAQCARQDASYLPRCRVPQSTAAGCWPPCPGRRSSRHNLQPAPCLQSSRLGCRLAVRAAATEVDTLTYGAEWSTPKDSYVVLGLAHCFERSEDGGKLVDAFVIEPVSANSLECMVAGARTCFKTLVGIKLGDAMARNKSLLPEEFAEAAFCEDYDFRCDATARTWLRPHAQDNLLDIVPLGSTKANFNYNLDEKRVLNMENVVNDADNIKQDMSIDVYGRQEDDAEEAAATNGASEAPAAVDEDEDDGLDDLFKD